jgi:hypothetical protein
MRRKQGAEGTRWWWPWAGDDPVEAVDNVRQGAFAGTVQRSDRHERHALGDADGGAPEDARDVGAVAVAVPSRIPVKGRSSRWRCGP